MIPHYIHYCWFGKKEKPKLVKKCIESWEKYFPDWTIIEWNENSIDLSFSKFAEQALEEKKYAFVSDVVRLYALKTYGGIYFDTDVEVLREFDINLLEHDLVLGFETANRIATSFMAAVASNELIIDFLEIYSNLQFKNEGKLDLTPNVVYLTKLLKDKNLVIDGTTQELDNIMVYAKEYFSPFDYINCVYEYTDNSYCVHHFEVSWLSYSQKVKRNLKKIFIKLFGKNCLIKLRNFKNKLWRKHEIT